MNWDQIKGNWEQLKGSARQQWGKLTDDDLAEAKGDREAMIGKIQARYGKSKEEATQELDSWMASQK
ncbi:hypothetical protein ROJ8625_03880 [Roseivivax jejudonensis]|uniref:CsbD-like domain-containing protein n=1 Tax=Roseivivax jejudonensis TaxID=1529041 RepID=A0A1X7A7S2_9RHOB|nr:CsbD family protein [Roseivivax jejudonensis]SLN72763.1 hypothetical protein ROJ8625_03880 [Roseivivax jejudonensis]